MNPISNRRQFFKMGASTAGALVLASPIAKAFVASCGLTPPQTPGPFYPGETLFHPDSDLTSIAGHATRALGQVIYLRGSVLDQRCNPIEGATVEIWQACASGKYNNPNDTNTAPLDQNFKYWAEASTNEKGEYAFKTIIPGAYPADTDWTRPPHIHFKVTRLGYKELVTQLYFKGESLNDRDLILQRIPADERSRVIVEFLPSTPDLEPGSLVGDFDLTLQSVRS